MAGIKIPGQAVMAPPVFTLFIAGAALVICFFPMLFGVAAQKLTKRILSRTTTPVAWNFFDLKFSAWTIRVRLKEFRKSMDAENGVCYSSLFNFRFPQ
jgi:hypothetical protein